MLNNIIRDLCWVGNMYFLWLVRVYILMSYLYIIRGLAVNTLIIDNRRWYKDFGLWYLRRLMNILLYIYMLNTLILIVIRCHMCIEFFKWFKDIVGITCTFKDIISMCLVIYRFELLYKFLFFLFTSTSFTRNYFNFDVGNILTSKK